MLDMGGVGCHSVDSCESVYKNAVFTEVAMSETNAIRNLKERCHGLSGIVSTWAVVTSLIVRT